MFRLVQRRPHQEAGRWFNEVNFSLLYGRSAPTSFKSEQRNVSFQRAICGPLPPAADPVNTLTQNRADWIWELLVHKDSRNGSKEPWRCQTNPGLTDRGATGSATGSGLSLDYQWAGLRKSLKSSWTRRIRTRFLRNWFLSSSQDLVLSFFKAPAFVPPAARQTRVLHENHLKRRNDRENKVLLLFCEAAVACSE